MSSPALTVAVTVFNRERYLGDAIASVLASRFQDFKLLVLDDASTDGSVEIARQWARRDPRIEVVVNERNLGQFANRNRALEWTTTEYLKYHDSDDLMYPHCLEVMLPMLAAEPRASFALSGSRSWPGGPCPMLLSPIDCYRREFLGHGMFFCGPASALFRTAALRRLGGFQAHGVAADYRFWLRACRSEQVLLIPGDLFWYRIHPGQAFTSATAAHDYALAQGESWQTLSGEDCPLSGAELEQARRNHAWGLARLTARDLKAGRWSIARRRLKAAGLGPGNWLRYLRRPHRALQAGTPRTESGDYRIPEWVIGEGEPSEPLPPPAD